MRYPEMINIFMFFMLPGSDDDKSVIKGVKTGYHAG